MPVNDFLEYDHYNDRPGRQRGPSLPWTFAGKTLFIGGWIALLSFGILYYIENETKSWPETTGIVRQSAFATNDRGDALEFTYEFKVGEITYRSHTVNRAQNRVIGETPTDPLDPAAVVAKYPVGARVTVFYDAADPRSSVLEHGISRFTIRGLLASVLSIVLGLVIYLKRPNQEMDRQEAWEHHTRL